MALAHILIVEDEAQTAFTVEEAHASVQAAAPSLVMLDLDLGGVSTEPLAVDLLTAGLSVVICSTSNPEGPSAEELRSLPRIPKPYDHYALVESVRAILPEAGRPG